MKVVKKYECSDGTLFDDIEEAREHDRKIKLQVVLESVMAPAVRSGRAEAVIMSLISNAKEVRDVLSKYIQSAPKQKPAESDNEPELNH